MHHRTFRSHLSSDTLENSLGIILTKEKRSEYSTYVTKMKHKGGIFFVRTANIFWHSFCSVVYVVLSCGFFVMISYRCMF